LTVRALALELTGLPATGKSTLAAALTEAGAGVVAPRPGAWRAASLLVRNAGALSLPFALQCRAMGRRRWNRFHLMVRLQTLDNLLSTSHARGPTAVVLDQGPVYMLSILQRALHSPDGTVHPGFRRYWDHTIATWRDRLGLIVELDAEDDALRRRILARAKPHPVKAMSADEARTWFARSRLSRRRIVEALAAGPSGPGVLRLDTDREPPRKCVRRIMDALEPSLPME
jgi:hypothetical protein